MDLLKPTPQNSTPLTPLVFLERASIAYGECTSIIYNSTTTYTWSQTHRRCLRLASSLASLGIKRGQVVSVVAPNIPPMYELHFGVPMCGAILNTVNTSLDARTISILLRHGEAKLVFVYHQFESLVLEAISLFESQPPILIFINDEEDTPSSPHTYESLIENGDPEFKWVQPISEWDPMILNYTSGTTSSPKGVVHCHRGIFIVTLDSLIQWSIPTQPLYLWTLPMFHSNGWSFPWGMAAVGGTNICLNKFDAPKIYSLIREHGVTHMCGAPVVLNMLVNSPEPALPHPVRILTSGAPPSAAVLSKAESLGFVLSHGYGMTETAGIVVSCVWKHEWDLLPASEQARLKARQGVPTLVMADVDVIDVESGVSVKRDGSSLGEIVFRGGSLMLGYLKDPVATSKCMTEDGWFRTGDMGVMHSDGYLEIKDRSKDVIISGGENISSVEVESVLYSHPFISEAAVVARPDKFWGESPCAFVSLKSDAEKLMEKDILDFCRAKMPHYMAPKTVVFVPNLPKTSTGKIQKFVLREKVKALAD